MPFLEIRGARENNLKNISVRFPLGKFVGVSGVSGSGKSSLINRILVPALANQLNRAEKELGDFDEILGIENLDKIVAVDQSPIGRTPRSNPATYIGAFDEIRDIFSSLPDSKVRGWKAGRFSFNVKGGRCESCQGDGVKKIEMHFLPDIFVECEVCRGKRFAAETLEIKFRGRDIAEVLKMKVSEACRFFADFSSLAGKLGTLEKVGLGYLELGQPAPSLSGGEAQRVKLANYLARRSTGKTLFVLDEPTTGLHFVDIERLLGVLKELVSRGNSVLVIEHNLDVLRACDFLIDLGPEGGKEGGELVVAGTPAEVAECAASWTGRFLKKG